MHYVLFETISGKWMELVEEGARFRSSPRNATKLEGDAVSENNLHALLDRHNIDWYARTIEVHPAPED